MTTERRFLTADDAADFERWIVERQRQFVRELKPFLLRWAAASAADKPEALAAFRAQVALQFARSTAESAAKLAVLAIARPDAE